MHGRHESYIANKEHHVRIFLKDVSKLCSYKLRLDYNSLNMDKEMNNAM